jgi:type VI secretion system protein ImpG
MSKRYYEELAHLKGLATEFAAAHPALAPMLGGASADPDVERLLEGVAFQIGLLREKLDHDFPELVHDMVRLVCPHYLRPIPAATIVAFAPAPSLKRTQTIPAGTRLESVPVEGTRCQFRTCSQVEIHPLKLTDAFLAQAPGEAPVITLSLELNGLSLSDWSPKSLRLFFAGDYAAAADLYLLLRRHLRRIIITPSNGGRPVQLPLDSLQASGFDVAETVIPSPPHSFPGYRLIQEYFSIPNRFLFLDLIGWDRWLDRGSGTRFTVRFELSPFSIPQPRVKRESFVLFATPAVNLFSHDAEPILLDHRSERNLLRPAALPPDHVQIFSVDRVTGFIRGFFRERNYLPFERFHQPTQAQPAYHTAISASAVRPGCDLHLLVAYPNNGGLPEAETLSVGLTCTNGALAERLRIGDLCRVAGSTSDFATCANISPVTATVLPPLGASQLWRLLSHLSLNRMPLDSAENLRALLNLHLFEVNPDRASLTANRKRLDGIAGVSSHPADRLVRGIPMRGLELELLLRGDHFAGAGDLFVFGSVLDEFLAGCPSLNTFSRLIIHEVMRGEEIKWEPRLGRTGLVDTKDDRSLQKKAMLSKYDCTC